MECMTIINWFILPVRGPSLDVRIWRLQTSTDVRFWRLKTDHALIYESLPALWSRVRWILVGQVTPGLTSLADTPRYATRGWRARLVMVLTSAEKHPDYNSRFGCAIPNTRRCIQRWTSAGDAGSALIHRLVFGVTQPNTVFTARSPLFAVLAFTFRIKCLWNLNQLLQWKH